MVNAHERLRNMAAQIGHPDYSLVELKRDLLEAADDVEALSVDRETLVEMLKGGQRL